MFTSRTLVRTVAAAATAAAAVAVSEISPLVVGTVHLFF